MGEFKARLNRDIAFTIIDEQIQAGVEPAQLTGRGLAKQYGFGSPQTWVTHLKEWRQLRGFAPVADDVKEAETAPVETEPEEGGRQESSTPPNSGSGSAAYGMISRSEFLQHQEMWNRLLSEREAAHAERVKVARLEGAQSGRDEGRREGQALAEAREAALQERVRRERLEGEREGAQRAQSELAARQSGDRRLQVGLASIVGVILGVGLGGLIAWKLLSQPVAGSVATPPTQSAPAPTPPAQGVHATPPATPPAGAQPTAPAAPAAAAPASEAAPTPAEPTAPAAPTDPPR